jgi:hypothetical protein
MAICEDHSSFSWQIRVEIPYSCADARGNFHANYTTQTRHAQFSIHSLRAAAQNTLDGFSAGAWASWKKIFGR